ncbi:hypothetical protein LTR64_008401 [Lithohypha guttulata]|uniref:uncharacterized protein n=1 Tax=Lithohypha guttulata TaxID=1690604 RepID=UPI002DE0AC1E|nr:hypothetical protein LTR51_008554 [Lithohypha guttulata]
MPSIQDFKPYVVVVGAGPAGLLLALLLAKRNVPVQVIDSNKSVPQQARATHYASPAVYELQRAGVLNEVRSEGFSPGKVVWRKLDTSVIAGIDGTLMKDEYDRMVCLPLNRLCEILLDRLARESHAVVSWGYQALSIGQEDDEAWIEVEYGGQRETITASYIVGCDGANSQIRRSLFGDWEFPGKTWNEQIVATNTYYDFDKYGYDDSNFIIDREHWHMAARISKDGLWRVTYGEIPGLTSDELRARMDDKFHTFLPGKPQPHEYEVVNFSPYKVHQRLAPKMRVGRFCIAADAAHLCNPFGGLGLTGGIVDVGGLYDCLAGIYEGKADDSILDKYDEIRRQKYNEIVDPISSSNLRRLFDQDPNTALENDEFLRLCKKAEKDPVLSRQMQRGADALKHDFTQYYKT